ncbi:MAG: type II toxin-antitoxin system VapC family toxin [Candidatus Pacebacteria bacterium]|nr:type II toxin-antitoxin system VapC family toxin [Candidatus Paceibacterota bacterium]
MILLDTCALLWPNEARSRFPQKALDVLEQNADALAISAISLFEIGVKVKRGKLILPLRTDKWYRSLAHLYGLVEISISADIAALATDLPDIHRDPFDRLLIATALTRRLPILTADRIIPQYPQVQVVW